VEDAESEHPIGPAAITLLAATAIWRPVTSRRVCGTTSAPPGAIFSGGASSSSASNLDSPSRARSVA
jgi:hypothetical protein